MRHSSKLILALLLTVPAVWAATPRMTGVSPSGGHNGDEITANGQNLGSGTVTKLFLTDGRKDYRVTMKEQTADSIKFSIPKKLKPGYYNLMMQTGGSSPALLEQPISCQVLAEGEELIEAVEQELEVIEQEVTEDEEKAAAKKLKEMEKEARRNKKKKKKS